MARVQASGSTQWAAVNRAKSKRGKPRTNYAEWKAKQNSAASKRRERSKPIELPF